MSIFSKVPLKRPKRNVFNLSHDVKLTTEFGRITPFLCELVVPGDRWRISTNLMLRMAPMTAPVMQMFKVYQHFFYVPSRLVWSKWNRFIFGAEKYNKQTGEPSDPDPIYPRFKFPQGDGHLSKERSLFDYLGFPANALFSNGSAPLASNNYFDMLPFRAYHLIWNEFYRDENLQDEVNIGKDVSGYIDDSNFSDLSDLLNLHYISWRKDYFTSALPFAQRGPDVRLPIGGSLGLEYDANGETQLYADGNGFVAGNTNLSALRSGSVGNPADLRAGYQSSSIQGSKVNVDNSSNLKAVFTPDDGIQSATINEVRRAFAVQKIYELAARVGARPIEQLLGFFGVKSDDARLQRPEYLGGNVVPMYIGEVLQTSESNEDGTPLATPAGVGSASGSSKQFTHFFKEHGYIIGLVTVVPTAAYMQGLPRKFTKFERFDHFWPQFSNIGEQPILNKELYMDALDVSSSNDKEFGYTPRYAEYKQIQSSIHGDFRSSLDFWHDARKFASRPALNSEFITVKPSGRDVGINRIFAVTDTDFEDHLWLHIYNNIKAVRPMPKFGVPMI